jgi:hypothetical protein
VLTRDDLLDLLASALAPAKAAAPSAPPRAKALPPPGPKGCPFLSEHDIKKRLTPGARTLTLPRDAIISPLVGDWLTLRGIEISRV